MGPRFAYSRVMTVVSSDDDLDWEFAFDWALGIRPALAGANGEEIKEMVRGIAHLAPGCSWHRCRRERVVGRSRR